MGSRYNALTGDIVCGNCNIKAGKGLRCWVCGTPYNPNRSSTMQIKFTVNITRVLDIDGDEVEIKDVHYVTMIQLFRDQMSDVEHELEDEGRLIYFEMEDIEAIDDSLIDEHLG